MGCESVREPTLKRAATNPKTGKPTLKRGRLTLSRGKLDPRRSTPSTPSSLTVVRATAGEPGRQESTHLRCARECPYSARAGKTGRRACSRGNARYVPRLHQAPPADRSQSRARQAAGSCAAPVERPYTGAWRRHVNVAIGRHVRARGDRVRLRALLRASGALARRVPSNIPRRHRPRVAGRLGMLDGTCRALTKRT